MKLAGHSALLVHVRCIPFPNDDFPEAVGLEQEIAELNESSLNTTILSCTCIFSILFVVNLT